MIYRYVFNGNFRKCRFYEMAMTPTTIFDGETCIILTDELMHQWNEKATEIVLGEPINDACYDEYGNCIEGSEEDPLLKIVRITHEDGSVSIEPGHKLFPLNTNVPYAYGYRNSLLVYKDYNWELENRLNEDEPYVNNGCLYQYCRKFDVSEFQARLRTKNYSAKKWKDVLGKIDDDFCWVWHP